MDAEKEAFGDACASTLAAVPRPFELSTRRLVFPLESPENNKEATTATTEPVAATPIVTPVDSTDDVEGDESDIDIVLSQMKDRQH